MVVSKHFAAAILTFEASALSPWRTHRGLIAKVSGSPRSIHVLSHIRPITIPVAELAPFCERPKWQEIKDDFISEDSLDTKSDIKEALEPIFGKFMGSAFEVGQRYAHWSKSCEAWYGKSMPETVISEKSSKGLRHFQGLS